ncbi:MAG: cbb3-type cytochrome c oxidase subunit I, partial [Comamonas sp.]|jgi:cytochrome o ubiquinol oxidase subunit 1|nr:cbb3-type cytochrome c oxidase subunit I [Comamonas sp.]
VIIGGVVFAVFAGINYWYPKAFGYRLDEFWGKASFWFWFFGFWVAFTPLYVLGLMGVTRRVNHYEDTSLQIYFIIAAFGAVLIALGIACFFIQLFVSYLKRDQLRDVTGDCWNGRTLEWATSSPPPQYNFAFTPAVHDSDAWWDMKKHSYKRKLDGFVEIHMPKNTGAGFVISMIALVFGFAMIWHMWWIAGISFAGIVLASIIHTFNYKRDYYIPASEVAATEEERTQLLARHV